MTLPSTAPRPLVLMVEQVKAVTTTEVETSLTTVSTTHLPMVMVDVDAPAPVPGGAPQWGATFQTTITAMSRDREQALNLAHDVLDGLLASWRAGRATQHGWFSHLTVLTLPYLSTRTQGTATRPAAGAAGVWAFTTALRVTARH